MKMVEGLSRVISVRTAAGNAVPGVSSSGAPRRAAAAAADRASGKFAPVATKTASVPAAYFFDTAIAVS
ncbi:MULTISPECIES: hypothetical protein [unclassified Microbacterium]|uniref:hypothetical protein n=1 Tax=Microbacterium sp. Se63.02b TaxID=2709304 RepID=UPI001FCEE615|nr:MULTISPECIES: hypothetical protein [unclassified Microbacterium]